MRLQGMASRGSKIIIDNSPLILTALGVAGTVTTAVLTADATVQAVRRVDQAAESGFYVEPLTKREKFEIIWKLYLPAAGTGLMTCTCIVMANRIGTRRAAAVAAAYLTSQEMFDEYRDKIIEKIGDKKEQEAHDEIVKERAERVSRGTNSPVVVANGTSQICFDAFSGRFFESDMESLRKAENDINQQILHSDYASLTNFYNNIGLEPTSISDDMGWNTDKLLELHFSSFVIEDGPYKGKTALGFDFGTVPIRDYWRYV